MARGTSFGQLVEMVRDECSLSSNSSSGNDHLAYIKRLIKRHYEFLCDEYDWSFLRVENDDATKTLEAGERYYDFPVAMDIHDTIDAQTFYGNVWVPLTYGVTPQDYTAMNPETDQRADPVLKWRISSDSQFEVWPLPASNGNLVRFSGKRRENALVAESDTCDMDDQLVVLYVSAEILFKLEDKSAELKLAAAKQRLSQMRGGYADRKKVRVGMGQPLGDSVNGWPRIRAFPANP